MPALAVGRRPRAVISVLFATTLVTAVVTVLVSLLAAGPADAASRHHRHHRHHGHDSLRDRKIHHGLEVAINHKGDPYSYGSAGPGAFDCSGLTMFSYDKAGLHLPRTSDGQARAVRHIPKKNLHRGDFIFFTSG